MAEIKKDEHGHALRRDGSYRESTGSGPNIKLSTPIGPIDMPDLVRRGLVVEAKPNWDPTDPESNWACIGSYRKFTPERRAIFLSKLEETGRTLLSARFAGVNKTTIFEHRKADPAFDEACKLAEDMYHEMCAASITAQARAGMIDERWDKEGNLLSRRVSYETRLREKLLDRADPSYRDTSRQEVAVVGGAVVVPAPTDSVETWDQVVARHTGSPVAGSAGAGTHSLISPDVGPKALDEGRVIKRGSSSAGSAGEETHSYGTVLEAKGETVDDVGAGSPVVCSENAGTQPDVSPVNQTAGGDGNDTSAGLETVDRSELPAER